MYGMRGIWPMVATGIGNAPRLSYKGTGCGNSSSGSKSVSWHNPGQEVPAAVPRDARSFAPSISRVQSGAKAITQIRLAPAHSRTTTANTPIRRKQTPGQEM